MKESVNWKESHGPWRSVVLIFIAAIALSFSYSCLTSTVAREAYVVRAEWDETVEWDASDVVRAKVRGWPYWFILYTPTGTRFDAARLVLDAAVFFVPSLLTVAVGYTLVNCWPGRIGP